MKNTSVEIHVDILKYTQNNTLVLPSLRSLELFSPRSSSAALSGQYQREVNTLHTGPCLLPLCTMSRATMWGIALLFKLLISFYFFKLLPQRCWNLAWDNKKIFFSS